MTAEPEADRSVTDPIGTLVDLVQAVEPQLPSGQIRAVVAAVAGGRAKSRRLAAAVATRPAILVDGRSPTLRAVGDLLLALRAAGAAGISPPVCAECGKHLGSLQRRGQHWYCAVCGPVPQPCSACGNTRPVNSRDRSGHPRCQQCPDIDDRDPVAVIHTLIADLDPNADPATVADLVRRSAPRPSYQQKLAWALEDHRGLLTGDGHLAPLRAIPRLIELLHANDVAGIVLPACPGCHRVVRIDKPLNGQRVCRTCIAHSRLMPCAGCGTIREPVTRDAEGHPICANCFVTAPENLEVCIGCGRRRSVTIRTPDGPLCSLCPALAAAICSICGDSKPCGTSRATGRPWCPCCQRRTANCSACGATAPICSGTLAEPRCASCTPPPPWHGCPTCCDPDYPHPGHCARCLINKQLDELMGPAGALPAGLQLLRHDIATAEHTITARRWLTKPAVVPILSGLATGRIPLTHQGLDELPDTQPLAHLRQTLVAIGALPERDELIIRLERFIADLLANQDDPDRRRILHRYLTWHLVRRLRARNNGRPVSRQQFLRLQQNALGSVAFLGWLAAHDLTLATFRQPDLERWQVDETGGYRDEAGQLIRWAHDNKITIVRVGTTRWTGPTRPLDHEHRWHTARRLLHDDSIRPEDRLAGLLVLLYAQGVTAISRITVDQVPTNPHEVRLHVGRVPIHLPEPIATLARTVIGNRKGHATIGALTPSPWLFPGGQPGRPISTQQLTKRLNALGIRPSQDRSTALIQLATEIPAAILARTLGIHTHAAVAWQRHAAGDWAAYAAEASRREPLRALTPTTATPREDPYAN